MKTITQADPLFGEVYSCMQSTDSPVFIDYKQSYSVTAFKLCTNMNISKLFLQCLRCAKLEGPLMHHSVCVIWFLLATVGKSDASCNYTARCH